MADFSRMTKALKRLWKDRATITGTVVMDHDEDNPFDDVVDSTIVTDEPCKVSLKGLKPDSDKSFYNASSYDALLIIDKTIDIPSGARIQITDVNGKVSNYKRSSKGYTGYQSHQEVAMQLEDKA